MLDVSLGEMLLIGTVALVVLGPERLPKTARWLGKTLSTWKTFAHKTRKEIEDELQWHDIKDYGEKLESRWSDSLNSVQHSLRSTLSSIQGHDSIQATCSSTQPQLDARSHDDANTSHLDYFPLSSPSQDNMSMTLPADAAHHTEASFPLIFSNTSPLIGIVMGSTSDWKIMKEAARLLKEFGIPFEAKVVSAHRMPDTMFIYAATAKERGLQAIIAGAGGAAHLPGMLAAKTTIPVLGVPIPATLLNGQDALYSIVQMPKGIPVATFAIGEPGAANAALFAVSLLANTFPALGSKLDAFRAHQTATVSQAVLDTEHLD
jgi:5-(carboxyamino)imidazole ribonucleotide mutase